MKKIVLLPLLLGISIFFFSCKKDAVSNSPASISNAVVDVKITSNQPYQMDLSGFGTVSINKQAMHYAVSEAGMNNETGTHVYKYIPAANYVGNDEVQLASVKIVTTYAESNNGGCHSSDHGSASIASTSMVSQNITLKILVSN